MTETTNNNVEGPAGQPAYRVPRSTVDALFDRAIPAEPNRAGAAQVISVDGETMTVLIGDEEVSGVVIMGDDPAVGDAIELETRGDLVVALADDFVYNDTYVEGASTNAPHIVDDSDPGFPPPEVINVGGSMVDVNAWTFMDPDAANWTREVVAGSPGLHVVKSPSTLLATNYMLNPNMEGSTGWSSNGLYGYATLSTVAYSTEQASSGIQSLKVTWPDLLPGTVSSNALSPSSSTLVEGTQMCFSLRVFVPSGQPDVRAEVALVAAGQPTSDKDQWVWLHIPFTVPAGTTQLWCGVSTTTPVAGGICYIDQAILREGAAPGPDDLIYFDGSTPKTATETYAWTGAVNNSTSTRTLGQADPVLLTNRSFEVDTSGWYAGAGTSIARSTAAAYAGTASLAVTATAAGTAMVNSWSTPATNATPVAAGRTYYAEAYVLAATVGRSATIRVLWFDVYGVLITTTSGTAVLDGTADWSYLSIPATATPTNAVRAGVRVEWAGAAIGEVHYLDGVRLVDPNNPPMSAGELWSFEDFEVSPGDVLHYSVTARWQSQDFVTLRPVMAFGVENSDALPTDPAQTSVTVYGAPTVLLNDPVNAATLAFDITVPDTVSVTSGTVPARRAKMGVAFEPSDQGTRVDVQMLAASLTRDVKTWPPGSLWLNPAAPQEGVPTAGIVSSGNAATLPSVLILTAAPLAKKIVITAPPDVGGVVMTVWTLTINAASVASCLFRLIVDGVGAGPFARLQPSAAGVNYLTATLHHAVPLTPGQTTEIVLGYYYAAAPPTAFTLFYPAATAVFLPGGAMASSTSFGTGSPQVSFWDGDSWAPDALRGAAMDLSIDGATASPAKTATTTTLSRSPATATAGDSITLTATVAPSAATGSVAFYRGTSASGPWSGIGSATVSGGRAVKTYVTSSAGTFYFRAVYSGSTTHLTSSAVSSAVTVQQAPKRFTKTVNASWVSSYNGGGSKYESGRVRQGYYDSTHDNQKSLLRFAPGLPADANVVSAKLVCDSWSHWYYGSGGTLVVGWHGVTNEPASWTLGGGSTGKQSFDVGSAPRAFTVSLGSWLFPILEGTAFRGLVVGPGASTSREYYGYAATGAGSQWHLVITYDTRTY